MAEVPLTSEERVERKKTAAYILATASFGFLFLGLVALLISRSYHGSFAGDELIVAGAVGLATGIFLIVAVIAIWFDRPWLDRWND